MNDKPIISKVQEIIYQMKVGDATRKDVIVASPDTLMSELRQILRDNRISGIPIVTDNKLQGIISLEDFIKWLIDGAHDCPVRDKMTVRVQVLYSDEPLIRAVSMLEQTGFGRFPVVDRNTRELVGIITKGGIIERLLYKLDIDYREEENRHYSHTDNFFNEIIEAKTSLVFKAHVVPKDFTKAGNASSELKNTLTRLGIYPDDIRRTVIAAYEAEMNLVVYAAEGGDMLVEVDPNRIHIEVVDNGPGIEDVELALTPGFSTAPDWVRELGFGAGLGLCNIKKCTDEMKLTSVLGQGTRLSMTVVLTAHNKTEGSKTP